MNKERALKTLLTYDGLGIKENQEAIDYLLLEQGFEIVSQLKKMEGAIDYDGGGSYTFSFTPTTLGTVIKVKNNAYNKEIDLSDYKNW